MRKLNKGTRRQAPNALPNQSNQVRVDIAGKLPHSCQTCNCTAFEPSLQLYIVPGPEGQTIIARQEVMMCCNCKAVFIPNPKLEVDPFPRPPIEWGEDITDQDEVPSA